MFDDLQKQQNNQQQENKSSQTVQDAPQQPVAPEEDVSQKIERLREKGVKQGSRKKLYSIIGIAVILFFVGGVVAGSYFYRDDIINFLSSKDEDGVACPTDAKICPDGSSVGRIPPDCEFAECPAVEEKEIIKEEIDISDWQTYRNEYIGIEFKYPKDFHFTDFNSPNEEFNISMSSSGSSIVRAYMKESTINDWMNDSVSGDYLADRGIHNQTIKRIDYFEHNNIIVDNRKGVSYEMENCDMHGCSKNEMIIIEDNNEIFVFVVNQNFKEVFNKMLTTVKFINKPEESITSNWQIYQNEDVGFKVKYPGDWQLKCLEDDSCELSSEDPQNCVDFMGEPWCLDNIFFNVAENKDQLDIDAYLKQMFVNDSGLPWDEFIEDFKEIKVDNQKAYSFISISPHDGSGASEIWLPLDDGNFFTMTGSYLTEDQEEIFNQIISTFKFLRDTDNDGLFDDEEEQYGTDINNPDSDGDGFLDGDEVENGYDPNGPGKL